MRPLYFIASYPRSGNTWVRAFIFALLKETGRLPEGASFNRIDLLLPWDIGPLYVEPVLGKKLNDSTFAEMARVRPLVHKYIAEHHPFPPIVKTHAAFGRFAGHDAFSLSVFRGATYLVRNPLDVAPSVAKLQDCTVAEAIETMARRQHITAPHRGGAAEPWGDWSFNLHSWTEVGPKNVLLLKYEDMRADPQRHFEAFSRHVGIAASPDEVRRALEIVDLQELEKLEAGQGFRSPAKKAKTFFGTGARLDYRDKLTSEEARALISSHALRMEKFGYLDAAALDYAGLGRDEALASSRLFLP